MSSHLSAHDHFNRVRTSRSDDVIIDFFFIVHFFSFLFIIFFVFVLFFIRILLLLLLLLFLFLDGNLILRYFFQQTSRRPKTLVKFDLLKKLEAFSGDYLQDF